MPISSTFRSVDNLCVTSPMTTHDENRQRTSACSAVQQKSPTMSYPHPSKQFEASRSSYFSGLLGASLPFQTCLEAKPGGAGATFALLHFCAG